jgi:hypothetical protein
VDILDEKKKLKALKVTVQEHPEECRYKTLPDGTQLLKEVAMVKWKFEGAATGDICYINKKSTLLVAPYVGITEYDMYIYAGVQLTKELVDVELQIR